MTRFSIVVVFALAVLHCRIIGPAVAGAGAGRQRHRATTASPTVPPAPAPSTPAAQQSPPRPAPADRQRPSFRAGIDIVSLNVTVTDGPNHYVTDLEQSDFSVFEDGVKQDITFFTRRQQPIALSLLLDSSASMEEQPRAPCRRQPPISSRS